MKKNIIIIHSLIVLPLLASSPLLGMYNVKTPLVPPAQRKLIRESREKVGNGIKGTPTPITETPPAITITNVAQETTPLETPKIITPEENTTPAAMLTAVNKETTPGSEMVVAKSSPIAIAPRTHTQDPDPKSQEMWGSVLAQLSSVVRRQPADLPTANVTTKVTQPAETVVAQNNPILQIVTTEETKTTPTIETPAADNTETTPPTETVVAHNNPTPQTNTAEETETASADKYDDYFGLSVIEKQLTTSPAEAQKTTVAANITAATLLAKKALSTSDIDQYVEIDNLAASVYEPVIPSSKDNLNRVQRTQLWYNPATYILAALKDGSFNPTWLEHQEGLNKAIKYLISKENTSDLLEVLTLCRQKHASEIQLDIDAAMAADAYLTEQDYKITNPLRIEVLQNDEAYIAQEHVLLATLAAKLTKTLKEFADEFENGQKKLHENYQAHQKKRAPSISQAHKDSLKNQEAITYVHKLRRTDLNTNGIMTKDYENQFISAAGITPRLEITNKHITNMAQQYLVLQRTVTSAQNYVKDCTESQLKLLKQ